MFLLPFCCLLAVQVTGVLWSLVVVSRSAEAHSLDPAELLRCGTRNPDRLCNRDTFYLHKSRAPRSSAELPLSAHHTPP